MGAGNDRQGICLASFGFTLKGTEAAFEIMIHRREEADQMPNGSATFN